MARSLKEEGYLVPHSFCELGEMMIEQGRANEARTYVKKAQSFSNYDLDKPLSRRLIGAMDRIEKM